MKGLSPKKKPAEQSPAPDFVIRTAKADGSSARSSADGAGDIAVRRGAELSEASAEAVRKMRAIPVDWRTFHINLGAYLYCSMFKMPLPPNESMISKPEVIRWLKIKPADQVIRHQFMLYK